MKPKNKYHAISCALDALFEISLVDDFPNFLYQSSFSIFMYHEMVAARISNQASAHSGSVPTSGLRDFSASSVAYSSVQAACDIFFCYYKMFTWMSRANFNEDPDNYACKAAMKLLRRQQ